MPQSNLPTGVGHPNMRYVKLAAVLSVIVIAVVIIVRSCGHKSVVQRHFDPKTVAFNATYNPNFEGMLYPSMVLALANYSGSDSRPMFTVEVTAPTSNAVLRVVVDSTKLNYVSILQEVLPKKGETYRFEPLIKWKYDYLYTLRQQGAADFTFKCYINDEEVDIKNLRLNYRTVNECPLSIIDTAGQTIDYRWLFAAYVNEDHPYIDSILSTILRQGIVKSFSGYQKGKSEVSRQVQAVWYYALNRGIAYSSISCTSNPSRRANTQHIRFFDEVYLNRQANCIDACVFLASILRKIGLYPVILVEPCHAYLGYYTDRQRKHIALLETTITSWVNMPQLDASVDRTTGIASSKQIEAVAKYTSADTVARYRAGMLDHETFKKVISRTLFYKATEYDNEQYKTNVQHFLNPAENTYQMLVVDDLRKVVQPIQR